MNKIRLATAEKENILKRTKQNLELKNITELKNSLQEFNKLNLEKNESANSKTRHLKLSSQRYTLKKKKKVKKA